MEICEKRACVKFGATTCFEDGDVIVAILEHYGADLSRIHGEGWRPVRCPFHDDRHASASVSLGRDAFKCFTCDAKGDAITLIMQHEGVDREDAVRIAETITGETVAGVLRTTAREQPRRPSRWRSKLFDQSRD